MTGVVESRLAALGLELPRPMSPVANFVPCVQSGQTLFVSGQITSWNGELRYVGKVGREITPQDAADGARLCALNILAQVRAFLGGLDSVNRVCSVQVFVNAVPDFTDHPSVANGASDVLVAVFGDSAGKHARFAVGAGSLPFNVAVEVAAVFELGAAS